MGNARICLDRIRQGIKQTILAVL
eukprot:SAG11_NODE_13629_length_646_cov_0.875686_2_plen_23_part_01